MIFGIGEYYKRIILSFNSVCKFSANVFGHKQRSLFLWTILHGLCDLEKIGRLQHSNEMMWKVHGKYDN